MPKRGFADLTDPTKKVSQEERIGRTQEKLGESDRRSLAMQNEADEEAIRAKLDMNKDADVSDIRARIANRKMTLQHDDDLTPKSETERDRLAARAKALQEILQKEMPTKREMWPRPGSTEAQQAVRHNLQFQEKRGEMCREWQDIQKKLNPEDPYAQSLELIRPD